ncbi:MAG: glycosyltransferase family 4 protein [Leptospira sp.]|nr:glycosyltransferase family 4 protein [Leptospira sp.]
MKIILDNIVFKLQRTGGISVYWADLIRSWERSTAEWSVLEYGENSNLESKNLSIPPDHSLKRKYRIFERIREPEIAMRFPFLLHSSYYRTSVHRLATNVISVYDFIHEKFRRDVAGRMFTFLKKRAIENSHLIICISESTKNDLLEYYPSVKKKSIEVIYIGTDPIYRLLDSNEMQAEVSEFRNKGLLFPDGHFSIFLGSRAQYKNFELSVEMVSSQRNLKLAIVGGGDLSGKHKELLAKKLPERFLLFPSLSNRDLRLLYNSADCLLYPSAYEGFGIPVIEAMASGCPVLALNNSSIPEITGADYPLGSDSKNLGILFHRILSDAGLQKEMRKIGIERNAIFDRQKLSDKTTLLVNDFGNLVQKKY